MAAADEIGLDFLGDSTSVGYSTTSGYKSINAASRVCRWSPRDRSNHNYTCLPSRGPFYAASF
jgi:hypothetical protein